MNEDAVTNLIVNGGQQFVQTLTNSADAQDRLTNSIRNASTGAPERLNTAIQNLATSLQKSNGQAAAFTAGLEVALKQMGIAPELANQVTNAIQRQSKAFQENAAAINKAAAEQAAFDKARSQTVQQALAKPVDPAFLKSEQDRRAKQAQDLFTSSHPDFTAKTSQNLFADTGTTTALQNQTSALDQVNTKGLTYLSTLSALHAGSFLLTGSTFSTGFSILTLGAAFSKAAPAGTLMSGAMGALGASLGLLAAGINFVSNSVATVISIIEAGGQAVVKVGAGIAVAAGAIVVASTKLASNVEDVLSEVAAFGEPTIAQFTKIEDKVSSLARTFGVAATAIGSGASLFIRAGGEIEKALSGGIEAVTKLTIASRGELIPATAARTIVTVTNAFAEFKDNALGAADIIVGTAQKTALSFSEVTQALQQAGPTAALLKIPFLDLATTIGVLANNGLRGQLAGTGFKQVLLDLLRPSAQAAEKLQELGISIQDSNGKVRPLIDIFADFKTALGDLEAEEGQAANAHKAQALAAIFGSRANLAAAIIARTGAEAFVELRTAIAGVSATEVVEVLLSTTSSQANIARTNIEELARAFGGPLNVAVGSALKTVNSFLQGIDRKGFELAGQAIIAVFTGGGFGQIQTALDSIDNSQIRQVLTGVLDTALTVRNAIVNQLIPAFQTAGTNISSALSGIDSASTFRNLGTTIAGLITAGSRLVIFLSEVAASFIKNDERGQEMRRTLEKVADFVKTTLTLAFTGFILTLTTGALAIQLFGTALQKLTGSAATLAKGQRNETLSALILDSDRADINLEKLNDQLTAVNRQIENMDRARGTVVDPDQLKDINDQRAAFEARRQEILKNIETQQGLRNTANAKFDIESKKPLTLAEQINAEITNVDFSHISSFLEGDLPTSITAVAAKLKEIQDELDRGGAGDRDPTDSAFVPDPKKLAENARQINDIIRGNREERQDIIKDFQQRELELETSAANRLLDLTTRFNRAQKKVDEDKDKRLKKSDEDFAQRRSDRDELQVIQRGFEDVAFLREQDNAKRDQLITQQDAAEDRQAQRRIQAEDRVLGQLQDREQQSQNIINQIRDTGFQRQQQDQETAFGIRQSREDTAFSRSLQNQATARDNALRLAAAKTPQERADISKQIVTSGEDTKFQRKQEDQTQAFRIRQDAARTSFQRSQQDTAFQNQIKNEQAAFDFRVSLEQKYILLRQQLEDRETVRQSEVERIRLLRRLGFQVDDKNFRRDQQDSLQTEQDRLADKEHQRNKDNIIEEAELQKQANRDKLSDDIFGLFEDVQNQSNKNKDQALTQLRNLDQRAIRQLQQLAEREPTAASPVQAALLQMQVELIRTDLLIQKNNEDATDFFNTLRAAALIGAGVPDIAPNRQITLPVQDFTPQQNALINTARIQLDPSPILLQLLPAAVVAGIRDAQLNAQGNRTVTINNSGAITASDFVPLLQRLLTLGR